MIECNYFGIPFRNCISITCKKKWDKNFSFLDLISFNSRSKVAWMLSVSVWSFTASSTQCTKNNSMWRDKLSVLGLFFPGRYFEKFQPVSFIERLRKLPPMQQTFLCLSFCLTVPRILSVKLFIDTCNQDFRNLIFKKVNSVFIYVL